VPAKKKTRKPAASKPPARAFSALRRLISAQDDERQRIARDLHDNFGQQVTALRLLLDSIASAVADAAVQHRVREAHLILARLDRQLDFLTAELRPVAFDLGAVSAIRQFVVEWSTTLGVAADFHSDGVDNLRLTSDVETHLYRVVQEALNNVSKHADARHVDVRLERRENLVVLTVTDDGCGFNVSERARGVGHGLGLVGMRERAQIINGTIDLRSARGQGTIIVLQVPVAPRVAEHGGKPATGRIGWMGRNGRMAGRK
jgi:two-component system sensor histidine kinase NreB